jgi:beta-lactamase superfamily II metal-dependent hydrolase
MPTLVHPPAFTLDALSAAGSSVWRTDGHGTVTFEDRVPVADGER